MLENPLPQEVQVAGQRLDDIDYKLKAIHEHEQELDKKIADINGKQKTTDEHLTSSDEKQKTTDGKLREVATDIPKTYQPIKRRTRVVTGTYMVVEDDYLIIADAKDADVEIILPSATCSRELVIRVKRGSDEDNDVVIAPMEHNYINGVENQFKVKIAALVLADGVDDWTVIDKSVVRKKKPDEPSAAAASSK